METKIETNATLVELAHLINQNTILSPDTKLAMLQLIKNDENKIQITTPKESNKKKESSLRRLSNSPTFFNLPGIKNASFIRNSSASLGSPSTSNSASSSPKVLINDLNKFPLSEETNYQYMNTALIEYEKKKNVIGFTSPDEQYEIVVHCISNQVKVFLVAILDILGEGVAGKVCKAWDMETKELLAAKVYNASISNHMIKDEVRSLSLNHLSHGYFPLSPRIVLMNYTQGRPLLDLLYETKSRDKHGEPIYSKKNTFAPFVTLQCVYKLLDKLSTLHQTKFPTKEYFSNNEALDGLLHRDLKPANILVDIKHDVVDVTIIDYADMIPNRKDGQNSTTCCGSNGYVPPEVIGDLNKRKPYVKQSDFFQAGIVIAEMMSSRMYQPGIQKVVKEHGLNFNEFWSLKQTQKLMSDVFKTKHYTLKLKPSFLNIEQCTQEVIYKTLVFPVLRDLAISMTHVDPELRLKNTTLGHEIERLKAIEGIGLRLAKNLQEQVKNALAFWQLGKELSKDLSKYVPLDSSANTPAPHEQMEYMESDMKELINTLVSNHEGTNELKSTQVSSFL